MRQNCITGVFGGKGQGKSSYAMKQFLHSQRALAFDIRAEYKKCLQVSVRLQLIECVEGRPKFRVAFRPGKGKEQIAQDLNLFCRIAFAMRDVDVFLEEADYFCTAASSDPALDGLVRYGRDPQINIYYTTRRFQEVAKGLTSQTDEYVLFRIFEPRDLEQLAKRFGPEIEERVTSLVRFQYIKFSVVDPTKITEGTLSERTETKDEPEKRSDIRSAGVPADADPRVRDGERAAANPGATDGE